jgi:hypothetical protein
MDELFLLPPAPVAMPRAYWLDQPSLSSQIVVLEPSRSEWQRIQERMTHADSGFDMDILDTLYAESCIVLPHRRYDLISGEFRNRNHDRYLGLDEVWDASEAIQEAKYIHFSDWPVLKPWLNTSDHVIASHQPECKETEIHGSLNCLERDIWLGLYAEFAERR